MNRTLILLLLVLGLGAGTWFLLKNEDNKPATSVVGADRDFAVERDLVYKIFLADRNGGKTTLERKGDGWVYDGKYKVRKDAINNLLSAISSIRLKFVPTNAAVPNMIESLATHGIKVEIYGKDGEELKTYYVGGATNEETGTFVILEGEEQPYVAELSNWTGNLRFRYNLQGDDWRDRGLFTSKFEDIAEISIDYPKQQNNSFRLKMNDGQYDVTPYYPLTPSSKTSLKKGSVEAYASNFEAIYSARYNNYNKDRDSIVQQIPFAIISLEEKNGDRYSLKLFPKIGAPFIDPKTKMVIEPDGVESYYGLTGTNDFMIVQNGIMEDLLWGYPFFFE